MKNKISIDKFIDNPIYNKKVILSIQSELWIPFDILDLQGEITIYHESAKPYNLKTKLYSTQGSNNFTMQSDEDGLIVIFPSLSEFLDIRQIVYKWKIKGLKNEKITIYTIQNIEVPNIIEREKVNLFQLLNYSTTINSLDIVNNENLENHLFLKYMYSYDNIFTLDSGKRYLFLKNNGNVEDIINDYSIRFNIDMEVEDSIIIYERTEQISPIVSVS